MNWRILVFLVAAAVMLFGGRVGAQSYEGALIDAHSQIDCAVGEKLVMDRVKGLNIRHVLISIRGCRGISSEGLEDRILGWAKRHPERISVLLASKVDGGGIEGQGDEAAGSMLRRARRGRFVGLAEVLVHHAPNEHRMLSYPGLKIDLFTEPVPTAIALARNNGWPVILHLEFNDVGEKDAARAMVDLKKVLDQNRHLWFGLIHMAQLEPNEARMLIEAHENVFFLTSSADPIIIRATQSLMAAGGKAQTGWINMFAGEDWKPDWRKLITDHPGRFVLAFDNVFPPHWERRYAQQVPMWRNFLGRLPPDVAKQVACENAVRLWKLGFSCD
jgi:hypothetical protein